MLNHHTSRVQHDERGVVRFFRPFQRNTGIAPRVLLPATTFKNVSAVSAVRTPTPEMIGIREFARRDGCDEKLVRNAIRDGHLPKLASKKLDARLVGTGWRLNNRRGADTCADRGRDGADNLRSVRTISAVAAPRLINANDLADLASAAAYDVAKLMLVMLPRAVLDPVLKAFTRELHLVAADLLQEGGVPPPAGISTWRDYSSFARPTYYMDDSAWKDAAEASAGRKAKADADA